jgi:hypothetical protein
MPLTALGVRHAKPKDKPYKLSDEKGLYFLVTPSGGKLCRAGRVILGRFANGFEQRGAMLVEQIFARYRLHFAAQASNHIVAKNGR